MTFEEWLQMPKYCADGEDFARQAWVAGATAAREACAMIVDNYKEHQAYQGWWFKRLLIEIAASIRGRGESCKE